MSLLSSLNASPMTIAGLQSAPAGSAEPGQTRQPAPPGVRGGAAPAPRSFTSPGDPISLVSDDLDSLQQQLDGFKPQLDNTGKPIIQPDVDPLTPSAVPKYEEFKDAAARLAQSIQVDEQLATTALQGDAGSLQKLLQGVVQQALQQSMHVSAGFANTFAHEQAKRAVEATQKRVSASSSEQTALTAAYAVSPTLNSPMGTEFLRTTMAQLRKEYPTAPAELIGKFAASKIMSSVAPKQKQQDFAGSDVNWSDELTKI